MMRRYDEKALDYPPLESPEKAFGYKKGINTTVQDEEEESTIRNDSVFDNQSEADLSEFKPLDEIKQDDYPARQNFSLGVMKVSEIKAKILRPEVAQKLPTNFGFLKVTPAVPILDHGEVNGVKIMPAKDKFTPIFTPPVYDRKKKRFYHAFFHAETGKYMGEQT
mmetsp:Transcript_21520/g.24741  ORF Transcript_21520/g.24741 Transcript_21520/m.24741 type:complete len:165 (+) Transcript_21520:1-495(+)